MALFGSSAPVDPALSSVIVAGKSEQNTLRQLAKCQELVKSNLESGEVVELATYHSGVGSSLLIVTNRRSITFTRRKVDKELRHDDVVETRLLQGASSISVAIESRASRMNYHPNDAMKYTEIITVDVPTPGEANQICAAIDRYLN